MYDIIKLQLVLGQPGKRHFVFGYHNTSHNKRINKEQPTEASSLINTFLH